MVNRMLRNQQRACMWLSWSVCLVVLQAVAHGAEPGVAEYSTTWVERGEASVYASKFKGLRTASGVPYNSQALTAAHPSLPFGTLVRVTSLTNGKTVVVRINDRGPFVEGRIIDLSRAAAQALRLRGLMQVEIEQIR
jgi:rare lipoprotein A